MARTWVCNIYEKLVFLSQSCYMFYNLVFKLTLGAQCVCCFKPTHKISTGILIGVSID